MTRNAPAQDSVIEPLHIASASAGVRHVFIRDLVLHCSIGIHDHEKNDPQRVRINLDLGVLETPVTSPDTIADVVCYEAALNRIKGIASDGHVGLVEVLAERIADVCLQDARCRSVRVRVEKLDVFDEVESVGVEIERVNTQPVSV